MKTLFQVFFLTSCICDKKNIWEKRLSGLFLFSVKIRYTIIQIFGILFVLDDR